MKRFMIFLALIAVWGCSVDPVRPVAAKPPAPGPDARDRWGIKPHGEIRAGVLMLVVPGWDQEFYVEIDIDEDATTGASSGVGVEYLACSYGVQEYPGVVLPRVALRRVDPQYGWRFDPSEVIGISASIHKGDRWITYFPLSMLGDDRSMVCWSHGVTFKPKVVH